jgi:hypothetical protein
MTRPGIELRWGEKGKPDEGYFAITNPTQRDVIRAKIRPAADIAITELGTQGIEVLDCKRLVLWGISQKFGWRADTTTSKNMNLYLLPGQAQGRIDVGTTARTIGHELLHCEWFEKWSDNTVGDIAITEGISYLGDYWLKDRVDCWRDNVKPFVERVLDLPKAEKKRLLGELIERSAADLKEDIEVALPFMRSNQMSGTRKVDIAGILAVNTLRQEGATFADLINMHPLEILEH